MKRVLLVCDSHKWCFGHMARGIKKYAPSEYEVVVVDSTEFHHLQKKNSGWHFDFDAICQFAWSEATYGLPLRNVVVVAHEGFMWPYPPAFQGSYLPYLSTPNRNLVTAGEKLPMADRVIFFTEEMRDHAKGYLPDTVTLSPAVDREIFHSRGRLAAEKGLHVGWCSQPALTKGHDLLARVMAENQNKGIVFHILNNRATDDDVRSPEQMADWYRKLDCFLCTAASEGGPLTVLEAQSCGVPVISTPVGVAKDVANFVISDCHSPDDADAASDAISRILQEMRHSTQETRDRLHRASLRASRSWHDYAGAWLDAIVGK